MGGNGLQKVATRFNVPSLPLITVSASYTAANLYINQLVSKGILSLPDSISDKRCEEELVSVPGLPLIRMCDLSGVNFKEYPLYDLGRRSLESLLNSDMIIFSGFRELDPRGFRALEKVLQICSDKNRIKVLLRPCEQKSERDCINEFLSWITILRMLTVESDSFATDSSNSCRSVVEDNLREIRFSCLCNI